VWISAEKGTGLDLLINAVAERLTRFVRKARIRVPASAGAVRSRLYAAKAVRDEQSADDGSIELSVELPDVELLVLARTAGVQILEVLGENMPCAPGRRTYNRPPSRAGPQYASKLCPKLIKTGPIKNRRASPSSYPLWRGINQVRTIRGAADRARRRSGSRRAGERLAAPAGVTSAAGRTRWRRGSLLLIVGLVALALWLASGFFQIKAAEQGVILRFGKLVDIRNQEPVALAVADRDADEGQRGKRELERIQVAGADLRCEPRGSAFCRAVPAHRPEESAVRRQRSRVHVE